jgi:hypothetical protein
MSKRLCGCDHIKDLKWRLPGVMQVASAISGVFLRGVGEQIREKVGT